MKFKHLKESLPLLLTFGAVLVVGVLFFSFTQAGASLVEVQASSGTSN